MLASEVAELTARFQKINVNMLFTVKQAICQPEMT
jgi:hypothetical protein